MSYWYTVCTVSVLGFDSRTSKLNKSIVGRLHAPASLPCITNPMADCTAIAFVPKNQSIEIGFSFISTSFKWFRSASEGQTKLLCEAVYVRRIIFISLVLFFLLCHHSSVRGAHFLSLFPMPNNKFYYFFSAGFCFIFNTHGTQQRESTVIDHVVSINNDINVKNENNFHLNWFTN